MGSEMCIRDRSGNLKRYKDVKELFHSFEKISDTHFKVQGNTVFISKL